MWKMTVYDLCIVGAGMVGSAAARHASINRNKNICLIGPEEPQTRRICTGDEVFGNYYDEGRIARCLTTSHVWSILAQRSIKRYRELENLSGILFYSEVGSLCVASSQGNYLGETLETSAKFNIPCEVLNNNKLTQRFPYMCFGEGDSGVYENINSGHINPRKLVAAQISVAVNQGCDVIRDIVVKVKKEIDIYKLITAKGNTICAKKVLLTTNVFTKVHDLLTNPPKFKAMPQTISFGRISKQDADRLRDMPSVVYFGPGSKSWYPDYPKDSDGNLGFYMLPPIQYPDGNFYIKIGHSDNIITELKHADIQRWFCGNGDVELENHLFKLMESIIPGVTFLDHHGDGCATMVTSTYNPYIDMVEPNLGVAIGGCGYAAKASDELGRVAAEMIMKSTWTYDIPKDKFRFVGETEFSSKL